MPLEPRGYSNGLHDSDDVTRTSGMIVLPREHTAVKLLNWQADQINYTDGSMRDNWSLVCTILLGIGSQEAREDRSKA